MSGVGEVGLVEVADFGPPRVVSGVGGVGVVEVADCGPHAATIRSTASDVNPGFRAPPIGLVHTGADRSVARVAIGAESAVVVAAGLVHVPNWGRHTLGPRVGCVQVGGSCVDSCQEPLVVVEERHWTT